MIKDIVCIGCAKGPCYTNESAVRPVLTNYKSYSPSSDLWWHYDFIRVYQCMDVINIREDVFQCNLCGFYFENHMLHTISAFGPEHQLCPDCCQRYREVIKDD